MPSKHEIELFISDTGELKIHVKGIKGPGCIKAVEDLIKNIGAIKEKNLTREYYEKQEAKNRTKQKIR